MSRYSPAELRSKLESGIWYIKFTKVNGEIRQMRCTRDFKTLEAMDVDYVSGRGLRKVPDHQIIVWDLDKNQWRSFRSDSVLAIQKLNNDLSTSQFVNKLSVNEVKNKLKSGTWKIRFQLTSGDYYSIVCTREFSKVLPELGNVEKSSRHIPENQIIVWDLNADAFRSFRYNSLVASEKLSDKVEKMWNKYINKSKTEIEVAINKGIWKFIYHKRDGSVRDLYGTMDPNILNGRSYDGIKYPHLILIYDIERKDFRNMVYSGIESMKQLKSFSELELSQVKNSVDSTIKEWVPKLMDQYKVPIDDVLLVDYKETDGESPAFCSDDNGRFILNFDLDKIKRNFPNKEKFIAFHELAHVVADLLINRRLDISEDQKLKLKNECKGHGPLFIDIMMTSGFPMTDDEFNMQYERHIKKYL